jgi:hypothetical protein
VLLLVAAVALLVKLPTVGTAAFWDEMAWLGQAGWLADNGLIRAVPGLRPDAQFFGHPPGLHFVAAVLFKVFGRSIEVAHVLIACLSAAGVCATNMLVRAAHDTRTAVLAALLLLFSPAWFSSAGVFLADLPVAALGVLCALFVMRGRVLAFFVTASCMVLIKETAVALVVALIAFRVLTRRPLTRATLKDALPYAAPLLVFAAFIIAEGRLAFLLHLRLRDRCVVRMGDPVVAAAGGEDQPLDAGRTIPLGADRSDRAGPADQSRGGASP